jgi:predicted phage terminase large subunit-like protein
MGRKKKEVAQAKAIDTERIITSLLNKAIDDYTVLEDAFQLNRQFRDEGATEVDGVKVLDPQHMEKSAEYNGKIRSLCAMHIKTFGVENCVDLYKRTLLFDAPTNFDAYCRYLEWNRPVKKRFYEPRRKQLLPIVEAMQELADGKIELLAISLPPGVGKTTLSLFFLTWFIGRRPDLTALGGSHSNSFLHGIYDEIIRILDKEGEYLYNDVFPDAPMVETNSKDMRIDLVKPKRFQNYQFSSIGSGNAGKVRASGILYCDDLVDGIETAMSRDRLDKLWQMYYTDLRQRKIGGCVELHVATRWSLYDPIGRLEMQYEGNPAARFLRFPAVNDNDESNFDYPYGVGFTTEFYRQQREIMDDASWDALYMNEPIERQGVLFEAHELRRYFSLPDKEPDDIIAVCDTKDSGPDYCVMPIAYKYGTDYYIEEIICDNGKPDLIEERLVETLIRHNVRSCRFESNRGAGRVAESVQERVKERGGITRITTKWTQTNKDARIVSESGPIKTVCLFKDESLYTKEYRQAITMLTNYTMGGKVKHDDVPDAFSMLSDFIRSRDYGHAIIMQRPF